jgi:hypothetical protein
MLLGLIILFSTSVSAQVLSIGVKVGTPLTEAMSAYQIHTQPIIAGLPPFDTCIECAQERTVPYISVRPWKFT